MAYRDQLPPEAARSLEIVYKIYNLIHELQQVANRRCLGTAGPRGQRLTEDEVEPPGLFTELRGQAIEKLTEAKDLMVKDKW